MDFLLRPGEQILMSGMANKWQKVGNKGGKLFLTNQRLVFKAHALNFGSKFDEYNLTDIRTNGGAVQISVTSYLVSFNITLYTKYGEDLSFVVTRGQKDEWVQKISAAVAAVNQPGVPANPVNIPALGIPASPPRLKVLQCGGCGVWTMVTAGGSVQCDCCGSFIVG